MKRLIFYIILMSASIYLALIYRNGAFLNIFYGSIFILLFLIVLNIISIYHTDISINTPQNVVQTGKKIIVEIILNNRGIIPTGRIGVFIKSVNSYTSKKEVTRFYVSADAGSSIITKCYYNAKTPGNIEFCIKKAWSEDYLGILRLPVFKHDKYEHTVMVIPVLYKVPVYITQTVNDNIYENDNAPNIFTAPDSIENGDIRQYIPGDSFKNIHWKLSAKSGELVSRQKYSTASHIALFFICPGRIDNAYKKRRFIQAVLSISTSLVSNGCIHYICWYNEKDNSITRYIVKQESDSYCFVQEGINIIINKKNTDKDADWIRNMYISQYNVKNYIPFIAINTKFELFADGKKIIQYDFKDLKNSIGKTEIVL
ncbi:MAG: DUF58 domain-containing protein [Lachnospiraceae bacterium]|nr:DUF58 domain-containing protein [Lachnospiraceae bacterium]